MSSSGKDMWRVKYVRSVARRAESSTRRTLAIIVSRSATWLMMPTCMS